LSHVILVFPETKQFLGVFFLCISLKNNVIRQIETLHKELGRQ